MRDRHFNSIVVPLAAGLAFGLVACGTGSSSPKALPPSTLKIDFGLAPTVAQLPALDGTGTPRKVTSLGDQYGTHADFVEDELIIVTDDEQELAAFVQRWHGQVLDSVKPADAGITGARAVHLVKVVANAADSAQVASDLAKLVPGARNDLSFGSQAGLDLMGALASAGASGQTVSLNWVLKPQGVEGPGMTEAPDGTTKNAYEQPPYTSNPRSWPYLQLGGPVDTGVTQAWRALSLAGRLSNKIPIAIFDGGFLDNPDLAGATVYGGFGVRNPATCSGGSPCPWHGTGSAIAAFGAADNGYGAVGPAGPVAERILVESPNDIWSSVKYPWTLVQVAGRAPRIVNISAATNVPAVPAAAVKPALSAITGLLRLAGVLVVAAAGNDGLDLDEEDCFIVCWHKRTAIPCELGNVLCVGAMAWNSRDKASYSNWGSNVDLWAPGGVWVLDTSNDNIDNHAAMDDGTSVASPFVAGVAGLVLAANPGLGPGDVEQILLDHAHTDNGDKVGRAVNAWAAVNAVLGPQPPVIRLAANPGTAPLRGETHLYSVNGGPNPGDLFSVFFPDEDLTFIPDVRVTSDLDGDLGVHSTYTFTRPGRRNLSITARRNGMTATAVLPVDVVNIPPTITNVTAPATIGLAEGWSPITPVIATDPNEPPAFRLGCDRVHWSVAGNDFVGQSTGCDTFIVFGEQGQRQVTVTATDSDGATTSKVLTVNVGPRPAQIPPAVSGFTVHNANGVLMQDGTEAASNGDILTADATIYNPDNLPVNLTWTLDDGVNLRSDALVISNGGARVEVHCAKLDSKRYFLQLFVGNGAAKKSFKFDVPLPPIR